MVQDALELGKPEHEGAEASAEAWRADISSQDSAAVESLACKWPGVGEYYRRWLLREQQREDEAAELLQRAKHYPRRRVSEEEKFEAGAPPTAGEQREVENDGEVQALLGACKRLEILRRAIRTIRRRHDFRA